VRGESTNWLKDIAGSLTPGQPVYVMFYAAAIVVLLLFYTSLGVSTAVIPRTT